MSSKLPKYSLLFLAFASLLCIAYWPAIHMDYIYHDDVNYFTRPSTQIIPPSQMSNFAVGRFVGAGIVTGFGLMVDSVSDLKWVRLMSVLQYVISAGMLFFFLKRFLPNTMSAFWASAAVFTLPAFQSIASHAGMCFQAYALPLALGAALCADHMPIRDRLKSRIINKHSIFAIFLMVAALATYPPTATFFWVPLGIIVLSVNVDEFKFLIVKVMNFVYVGTVSLVGYGLLLQLTKKTSQEYWHGMYNPSKLETDYLAKLIWFLQEPLVNALNLWNVFPSLWPVLGMLILILMVGIWWGARHIRAKRPLFKILCYPALFILILLLSFLPNLIASGKAPFYRCLAALSALVFLTGIWALARCVDYTVKSKKNIFLTILLMFICVFGIIQARHTLYHYRALPSSLEFDQLKQALSEGQINQYERIHVLRPDMADIRFRYDEFGSLTSRFKQDIFGLVTAALLELGQGQLDLYHLKLNFNIHQAVYVFQLKDARDRFLTYQVKISSTVKDRYTVFDKSTLVVDISKIFGPSGGLTYLLKDPRYSLMFL